MKMKREQWKNNIRCCISCILPCGALDVIRIVHSNGQVQEITCNARASEILEAHPKHVLKTHSVTTAAVIVVPNDAYLQRGKIYFLIPVASVGPTHTPKPQPPPPPPPLDTPLSRSTARRKDTKSGSGGNKSGLGRVNTVISTDQYLTELLRDKVVSVSRETRGRVGVWRPHLETISETIS